MPAFSLFYNQCTFAYRPSLTFNFFLKYLMIYTKFAILENNKFCIFALMFFFFFHTKMWCILNNRWHLVLLTSAIAAPNPAWHDPCLWYPHFPVKKEQKCDNCSIWCYRACHDIRKIWLIWNIVVTRHFF